MKGYPKIFQLGHRTLLNIFDNDVEITEKIDGSQFKVGKNPDGVLYMESKGAGIDLQYPQKLFKPVVEYFLSIQDKLNVNEVLYGETLCAPRHNTLEYDRIPKNHFAVFGISNYAGDTFIEDYDKIAHRAWELGVDVVPLLYRGKASVETVKELLNKQSYLGGSIAEGVVVKSYVPHELYGQFCPIQVGKFVTELFKEKHQKNPEYASGKSKVTAEFERYNTTARFDKAVQHLRDKDQLGGSPRDIGLLMKELNTDLVSECEDELKDFLWKTFKKDFLKISTRGFSQWYKEKLLEGYFDGERE